MMPHFSVKVEGPSIDTSEVRKALSLLIAPGEWHELRGIDPYHAKGARSRIINGSNIDEAVEAAKALSDTHVYWSLNPIAPGSKTANRKTVTRRRWLLIDVDTVRIKEVSATDAEKAKSYIVADRVHQHLFFMGWPQPLIIDSGNGWHLLYRIDLPNDSLTHQVIRGVSEALGTKFDNEDAIIDRVVHDAARISKLPGTMARKGVANAERPHRMAKIIYQPEELKVVTFEQLRVVSGISEDRKTRQQTPKSRDVVPSIRSSGSAIRVGSDLESYIQKAVADECYDVAFSQNNSLGRNNTLNRAAFNLGTLAAWPEMLPYREIHDLLYQASVQAGLDRDPNCGPHQITRSIESGWNAGVENPRPRPEPTGRGKNSAIRAAANEALLQKLPEKLTIGLDEVEVKQVDWLWQDRIAKGFCNIFAGRTGMGKSFVALNIAANLSRGESPPFDERPTQPGRTLVISEDPPEQMLAPRLLEMKADPSKIRFMTFKAMSFFQLNRIDMLEAAYQECGCPELIIIDPPSNFCGKTDTHKDAELRSVLMLVIEWVNRHQCAMTFIMHLNKSGGKGVDAISRLMGSAAWGTVARVVTIFEQDPDDPTQYLCAGGKSNIGPKAGTLAYRFEKTETLAKIQWIGPVETSADDAVNKVQKRPRTQKAEDWLLDRFRDQPSWPSEELYAVGKANGISRSAIWEAQKDMPIERKKTTDHEGKAIWTWTAPFGWPPTNDDVNQSHNESEFLETSIYPLHPISTINSETVETIDVKYNGGKDLGSVSSIGYRDETVGTVEMVERGSESRISSGGVSVSLSESTVSPPETLPNPIQHKDLPSSVSSVLGIVYTEDKHDLCLKELRDKNTEPQTHHHEAWNNPQWSDRKSEHPPELAAAIRMVSRVLSKTAASRRMIIDQGNRALLDAQVIDRAARVLKVVRTKTENGELWSKPE